jgi:hypothetical protein
VAVLGADAAVTPQEARAMVADLHVGIEIAGSPVADINALGPLASIACFGNNNGAILGPRIAAWHAMDLDALPCTARIDGLAVGQGDTSRLPGGIWAAGLCGRAAGADRAGFAQGRYRLHRGLDRHASHRRRAKRRGGFWPLGHRALPGGGADITGLKDRSWSVSRLSTARARKHRSRPRPGSR